MLHIRLSSGVVWNTAAAHDKTCVDAVSLKFGHNSLYVI